MYEYDDHRNCFRSVGYVRVGPMMISEIEHPGPDNTGTRDRFLMRVLAGVRVPERRAQRIVRKARHDPGR